MEPASRRSVRAVRSGSLAVKPSARYECPGNARAADAAGSSDNFGSRSQASAFRAELLSSTAQTGSSRWRDLPERFGQWNATFRWFDWSVKDGAWWRVLTAVQARFDQLGRLDWVVSIDSTIARVNQHGAILARAGARWNYKSLGSTPLIM
jgi:hypothetical protein